MAEKEFLARLGFSENPFQFTNADEEELLQSYFIAPPYFSSVWGNPDAPQSHVIFAPRGGGKSAQRRMIEFSAQENDVFGITYDRFEQLSGVDLQTLGVDYHLRNIIRLALLGFLLEHKERGVQAPAFSRLERQQIEILCQNYLGKLTKLEAIQASNSLKTLSSKAKEFLKSWSGPLNALIAAALATHGLGPAKLEPGQIDQHEGIGGSTKAHLEVVRDLIKSIGFRSVYVLVDKVDESPETGNDAEASFLLVRPLLRDLELLQMQSLGFKFFLWDKLEPHYRHYARPDRLQQFELSWSQEDINKMLSRRLEVFSDGKVKDLGQLTDAALAKPLQTTVVIFSAGSPRDMIRICQEMLSEQLRIDLTSSRIGLEAIFAGIAKFCMLRAKELMPSEIFAELTKVGRVDFTTNYVANDVFKIGVNSARNKIREWIQTGTVEKIGEISSGGRPIYHYALNDVRIAKAMFPHFDLVAFLNAKLMYCFKCGAPLIRDWDLKPVRPCSRCGVEVTKGKPAKNS
jgi:hypothetical protein